MGFRRPVQVRSGPQARDLGKVAEVPPDQRGAAMSAIADGVAACDCKVNVPLVRALMYLGQRGPE